MNKLLVLFLVFLSLSKLSSGQDTLITTEGDRIIVKDFKQAENECFYLNRKGSEKEIDIDDVFSLRDSLGKETIYYKQDTIKGFYDTQDEMKQYIEGMLAAQKEYKSPLTTRLGAGIAFTGAIASVTLWPGLLFWTPLIPVGYTAIVLKSKPDVVKITQSIPEPLRTEKYITGYVTQVKKKRVNNAIMGSIAGLVTGWVVFFAINSIK
jgi:hypothetical protein